MEHLRALAAHANYLNRVRACLAEEIACTCNKPHDQCDFGRWWYREVFPRKDQFTAEAQELIHTIDEAHQDFHAASAKISELSAHGNAEEAKRFETDLMRHSNRLIQAILKLDRQTTID